MLIRMDVIMPVFCNVRHDRCAWTGPPLDFEAINEFIQVIMLGLEMRSLGQQIEKSCPFVTIQMVIDEEAVTFEIALHVSASAMIADSGRTGTHRELVRLQLFAVVVAIPAIVSFAWF